MATRASQLGLTNGSNAGAQQQQARGYAEQVDRRTIDEIHRKEGVKPGQGGTCPHAAAGIAAAKRAAEMARQAQSQQAQAQQTTSFESPATRDNATTAKDAAVAPSMAAALRMNPSNPLFDYNGFYAEELDKKHKDKSYRCIVAALWVPTKADVLTWLSMLFPPQILQQYQPPC